MSNYISSFKQELLLINEPVTFTKKETGQKITVKIPTFKDLYVHDDLMMLTGIFEKEISEFFKMLPGVEIKNHFNFISLILALGERRMEIKELKDSIIVGLSIILPEFEVSSGLIKFKNDLYLDSDLFKLIQDLILESIGKEKPIVISEDDDEFTRREKEAEMRVRKIKESAQKKSQEKDNKSGIDDMIAALLYEYPQFKINDLFNMNMYTIQYLYSYVGKIANYEVMKVAAGNGLAKKFKYFTE